MSNLACPKCGTPAPQILGTIANDRVTDWACLVCRHRWPRRQGAGRGGDVSTHQPNQGGRGPTPTQATEEDSHG